MRTDQAKCMNCAHYYVTYDMKFPYGCKIMGFKSKISPDAEILRMTGTPCQTFQRRAIKPPPPRAR